MSKGLLSIQMSGLNEHCILSRLPAGPDSGWEGLVNAAHLGLGVYSVPNDFFTLGVCRQHVPVIAGLFHHLRGRVM